MSRQSLTKAHAKITELSWEPTFATPATRFGTDYTFEKAPKKDPLKQIMRSYFPMEEEKKITAYTAPSAATCSARSSSAEWYGKAVPVDHPLPGDLGGTGDADGHRRRAQPGHSQRARTTETAIVEHVVGNPGAIMAPGFGDLAEGMVRPSNNY